MLFTDGEYLVSDRQHYPGVGTELDLGYKPDKTFADLAEQLGFRKRDHSPKFYRFRSMRQRLNAIALGVVPVQSWVVENLMGISIGTRNLCHETMNISYLG